jgi:hypothetical protein
MSLGWAVKLSAPRAQQQGSTPGRCTIGCATPLHTSCSRTLIQCQQRPSSQRTRIHGQSVATYVASWASGGRRAGRCDGVVVECGARTTRESPTLATTMRSPCLTMDSAEHPLCTASKRWLRWSLSYIAAHAAT